MTLGLKRACILVGFAHGCRHEIDWSC